AAARVSILPPTVMVDKLDHALPLLVGGPRDAPARQQTLESAISWSYELLPENLRTILRGLSVFAGGWTLDAAHAVCDADVEAMSVLVESGLVRPHYTAEGRWTMLATIRQYASDHLDEAGDRELRSRQHAQYFLALAESLEPDLMRRGQASALARLEPEHDNLREALAWAMRSSDYELALRLGAALMRF